MMSLGGIVGGVLLYLGLRRRLDMHAIEQESQGRWLFQRQMEAVFRLARRVTGLVVNRSVQRSLLWLMLAALAAIALPLLQDLRLPTPRLVNQPPLGWLLWWMLLATVVMTLRLHRHRLLAVIVVGVAGLVVSLTFAFLSAPDLALTQLLVEMVTLALLLLAMNYLPPSSPPERARARKIRDGAIALAVGLGVGGLAYAMLMRPADTIAA